MVPERGACLGRLAAFVSELAAALGPAVAVETGAVGPYESVWLEPRRADALGVGWLQADDVVLSAGTGGRWDLEVTGPDIDLLEDIVRSVVAGRVTEAKGWRRSRVEVMLPDGTVEASTVHDGLLGVLPQPGWRAERRRYAPYR